MIQNTKTFIVAYISLFDSDLILEKVIAKTPEKAIWKHSKLQDFGDHLIKMKNFISVEEIKEFLLDTDILAAVFEI